LCQANHIPDPQNLKFHAPFSSRILSVRETGGALAAAIAFALAIPSVVLALPEHCSLPVDRYVRHTFAACFHFQPLFLWRLLFRFLVQIACFLFIIRCYARLSLSLTPSVEPSLPDLSFSVVTDMAKHCLCFKSSGESPCCPDIAVRTPVTEHNMGPNSHISV
jgi:hypothetical protein